MGYLVLSFMFILFRMISEAPPNGFTLKCKTHFSERFKVDYSAAI